MRIENLLRKVLWVDCIGALGTGLIMLALSSWVSGLYGFSREFVIGHAFVHLIYGTYSFSLAVRKRRPMALLLTLIFANAVWACLCIVFAITLVGNAAIFGVGHFILEGIYVGGLAVIEWKRRRLLLTSE